MKLNNWSCIGAELQGDQVDIQKMTRLYFYRLQADETISDALKPGFFNSVSDRVKENDLIVLYAPEKTDKRAYARVISNVGGQVLTEETTERIVRTIYNDLAELGDQVSNIEEKIPANASAQNQLATKADIVPAVIIREW